MILELQTFYQKDVFKLQNYRKLEKIWKKKILTFCSSTMQK